MKVRIRKGRGDGEGCVCWLVTKSIHELLASWKSGNMRFSEVNSTKLWASR